MAENKWLPLGLFQPYRSHFTPFITGRAHNLWRHLLRARYWSLTETIRFRPSIRRRQPHLRLQVPPKLEFKRRMQHKTDLQLVTSTFLWKGKMSCSFLCCSSIVTGCISSSQIARKSLWLQRCIQHQSQNCKRAMACGWLSPETC